MISMGSKETRGHVYDAFLPANFLFRVWPEHADKFHTVSNHCVNTLGGGCFSEGWICMAGGTRGCSKMLGFFYMVW